MPYNGSGSFSRVYQWLTDQANSILMRADRMDQDSNDIAAGLTNCITKDGQQTITANIPMNAKRFTNLGAGVAATDSAQVQQVSKGGVNYAVATGTANAIVLAMTPTNTALVDGQRVYFQASVLNTGATTLAVDGLGSTPALVNQALAALSGGEIVIGGYYEAAYSGLNSNWVLLNNSKITAITALTGDITASGSGSVAATLATVNSNVGTFPNATVTVNAKGQTTAISNGAANNAVTVTTNAGTCPATTAFDTFTNSSAATMAITIATSGAIDGQKKIVRIYDASGTAETIGWTNTENSTATVPTTSNGSTTLPLTVGFIFNAATTKWRCVAVA